MPMRSQAQRRKLWATDPALAQRFEDVTPQGAKLPERLGKASSLRPHELRELKELEAILRAHGYDPKKAQALLKEGMGPFELAHRIRTTTPGGMGSLEYTHGFKKMKRSLRARRVGAWFSRRRDPRKLGM
jgi:hypothetical protein